jgi:transcriptional regulator with XRE-family HTH domain
VRALRKKLDLTQDVIADRGKFPRAKMSKFESGENAATTADAQMELADGFGVPRETMASYLDEEIDLAEIIDVIKGRARGTSEAAELEYRYETLRRVVEAKRYRSRWSPAAIAAARSLQLDADQDPDEAWWLEALDRLDAAIAVSLPKVPSRGAGPLDFDEAPSLRPARKKR